MRILSWRLILVVSTAVMLIFYPKADGHFRFNSDGQMDIAVFIPATRQTLIGYFSNGTLIGAALGPTLPVNWQPDYLICRPDTGETAIRYLNNNVFIEAVSGVTLPP